MRFHALTALLVVTACAGSETPAPELPAPLTSERDQRTIHTTALAADRWESKTFAPDGALLFEMLAERRGDETTLTYTNHVWNASETQTQTLRRAHDNPLTFEQFHHFGIISFPLSSIEIASGGQMSTEYDNFGCDWPVSGASCGRNGGCCDTHDDCYAANGCSAGSWFGTLAGRDTACDRCNREAVRCFRDVHPGPSECCADGNCGQHRTYAVGGGGGSDCDPTAPWWECDPFAYAYDYTTLDTDYQDVCNSDPSLCLNDL